MPTPSQTFSSMQALLNYINSLFITNGANSITGEEGNNILNGLAKFIRSYTLNNGLARISTAGGVVVLPAPITVFTAAPTSIQWADNVQNEYYIINATGAGIPLTAGFSYSDAFGDAQTTIPARTSIHIAKATNNTWVQINNLPGTGGGSGLPPQPTHNGQFLRTDGASPDWADPVLFVQNADFEPDGVTVVNTDLANNKFMIFFDTLAGFIYQEDGQWDYVSGGGFKILIPNINANNQQLRLHLFLKGLNS